ncbi:aldo/keto reductase, partial [Burkholderia pseudomallei]
VEALGEIANDLGCTVGQLALAWVMKNPRVSTVITGASRVEQIIENMLSLDVATQITPDTKQQIEQIDGDAYQ